MNMLRTANSVFSRVVHLSVLMSVVLATGATGAGAQETVLERAEPTELNAGLTELDQYINAPDDSYDWRVLGKKKALGATIYLIDLKSQTWRTKEDVDRTLWQHWLTVVVPDGAKANTAMMVISGGSNGGPPPTKPEPLAVQVAVATRSVVANVGMIPNQPLTFHGDGVGRKEDDLIGYTWDQYLKTGEALWAARLPMTKAVVRAMDTVQELSQRDNFAGPKIEEFVVAGGSKRGWTT
jgi:PhoPQ-activated pathogenicity-related protein